MPDKILALVNTTGRQAASVARVAAAVGYQVRAQVFVQDGPVAQEVQDLPNTTIIHGSLTDDDLLARLFQGAQKAFVNTLSWDDEAAIGKRVANAAKKAGVQHYVYSSMPDHGIYGHGWPSLPHWSVKYTIEQYVRQVSGTAFGMKSSIDASPRSGCRRRSCTPVSTIITSRVSRFRCFA